MYAAFPFFLYLNASYGGYLLEPVFEYANSTSWTLPYAPRDIGKRHIRWARSCAHRLQGIAYPNATGNVAPHTQGVERTSQLTVSKDGCSDFVHRVRKHADHGARACSGLGRWNSVGKICREIFDDVRQRVDFVAVQFDEAMG